MSLFKTLMNMGSSPHNAEVLEDYYANESNFSDGLDEIARAFAMDEKPQLQMPTYGEPWRRFHQAMTSNGHDAKTTFNDTLATLPAEIQTAISEIIFLRANEIREWQKKHAERSGKQAKTADYLRAMAMAGYQFRFNLAMDEVEVNGSLITDIMRGEIFGKLYDSGFKLAKVAEYAMLMEAWRNRYHPIREYLSGLSYDGGHYIEQLCSYFEDEQGVFGSFLRRWLIGAVARAFIRTQNRILVLDGAQGIGKSRFVKWLCAVDGYFIESSINTEDKDVFVRLLNKWIWEVGELGSTTRKADREALKQFLTMEEVIVRKAYARYERHGVAMANFIGTVNNEAGILNDPTGNRRFMITKLLKINWEYTKLDVDQVWGEAYFAYLDGEPWDLTADEIAQADEINEFYQIEDPVVGVILKYFEVDDTRVDWWVRTIEIIDELRLRGYSFGNNPKAASMAVGAAMTKLGLKRVLKRNGKDRFWGYLGLQIKILP